MMRRMVITTLVLALALTLSPTASAQSADEHSDNMELLANWDDGGTYREGTDLAFWGDTAVLGKYGGMRLLDIKNPSNPTLIGSLDCNGSQNDVSVWKHPFTGEPAPRVLLYSSSYLLGGQGVQCNAMTQRKISVVEVPLDNPSAARVVNMPDVSPAVGCHDITVFLPRKLAVAACISESQVWDISDPARPIILSHIRNPAMQIHHSSAVSWDGNVLILGDEKGGAAAASGCNTSGNAPTGALWFYDISDPVRPQQKGWFVVPQNFDAGYVPPVPESRGVDVLSIDHPELSNVRRLNRLNPHTQEHIPGLAPGSQGVPVSADVRAAAAARPAPAALPTTASPAKPFCVLGA